MMNQTDVIRIDDSTDSVQARLVDIDHGEEVAQEVCPYPRWNKGLYCDTGQNIFRQLHQDHIDGLKMVLQKLWLRSPDQASQNTVALSFDATG